MASSRRLRALITNDDGIDSPGLWALAEGASRAGFDVVVAAPHVDASGVGGSVLAVRGPDGHVRLHAREIEQLPGIPAFAVEGHPAFIVLQAARGWLDPAPDVVLSGINLGANTGRSVLHSGTVGAALTAGIQGLRALAVSLDTTWVPPENPHWDAVLAVLPGVLDQLLAAAPATVLSLNVPDLPADELGPLREATLASFGSVEVRVDEQVSEGSPVLVSHIEKMSAEAEPGTDRALLSAGHPTLTRLANIAAEPGLLSEV